MPEINGLPGNTAATATAGSPNDEMKKLIEDSLQQKMETTMMMADYQDKSSAIDFLAAVMTSRHQHNQNISRNIAEA